MSVGGLKAKSPICTQSAGIQFAFRDCVNRE
ncbi:hypothetical protein AWB74_07076 [Caballeronia arvi]|uniref:Uncharacterized protein n=1 Tax=Caballeronia arvi TaxID=1777135 RepID=A0A158KUR6_9BURK|nr:hypothetical protein AWB74_07076 [Caballeronia arvi]